ncbi:hypothetical protein N7466_000855 [Penicillium verhagenii]|uniref:uncharacterized protein n=1 Tax=Penicillium verhagenii TaxID=1562060 RepID=UPI0025454119|nr:uncharacterized protein N7466_000855 [Penicillium verhagenii]KAJ5947840.1 hypothetical protein N7466_000855 [Penicillium verhagenii]
MTEYNCPPQPPLELNHSAEQLMEMTRAGIEASLARLALLSAKPVTDWTFDKFIVPFAENENIVLLESSIVEIYQYVSTEKDLRDSSRAAAQLWAVHYNEIKTRVDLFRGIDAIHKKSREEKALLNAEEIHYLDRVHNAFCRNAVHVDEQTNKRFQELQKDIEQLSNKCRQNAQEAGVSAGVWFVEAELKGLPASYTANLKRDADNRAFVALKRNDIDMIMRFATNETTRERMFVASENRCPKNIALFEELVSYRRQASQLVGYSSYAEYTIQGRMLDVSEVKELLDSIRKQVADQAVTERAALMKTKQQYLKLQGKAEQGKAEDELDSRIHLWDLPFYSRLAKIEKYDFDEISLAEYFPLDPTLAGILQIFERLFGLRFQAHEAWVWHDTVTVLAAWNETAMGGEFLGYIYLDLFDRPGKYNSNCNVVFAPGFPGSKPSIALLASFSSVAPTLLRHRNLITLFHELGHTIHYLVGQTRFASTWGTGTSHDFVEIPSSMLENWCWTPSVLHSLARHYTYTSAQEREAYLQSHAQLPDEKPSIELFEGLAASRAIDQGCNMLNRLHITLYDLTVYDKDPVPALSLSVFYNQLRSELTSLIGPESHGKGHDWGFGQANTNPLFHNYAAGYYVYFLCEAYSRTMFKTRFQQNPMDEAEGRRYRRIVLEKGGSLPELPLLEEFVGGKLDESRIF